MPYFSIPVLEETEKLQDIWTDYLDRRRDQERNKLVEAYVSIVESKVIEYFKRKGLKSGFKLDELVCESNYALIEAVEEFNPEKNVKFETYLQRKIIWKIKEFQRSQSGMTKKRDSRKSKIEIELVGDWNETSKISWKNDPFIEGLDLEGREILEYYLSKLEMEIQSNNSLSRETLEIVKMRYIQKLPFAQIAEITMKSESTANYLALIGLRKMQKWAKEDRKNGII